MFSSSVGRVIRPTTSLPTTTTAASRSLTAVSCRSHQRRPSSSKASVPPDGSKRIAPANGQQAQKADGKASARKSRGGRTQTVRATTNKKATFVPLSKFYPGMPDPVGTTQYLKREEIALMNLFAVHRPISVKHTIPEPISDAQFKALFQPRTSRQKHLDAMSQMDSAIAGLETAAEEMDETIHLDPLNAGEDPMAQYYRTNRPPPPPRPIEEVQQEQQKLATRSQRRRKGKSWQTTITVTEYTDGRGHRTFQADSSPIVRVSRIQPRVIEEPHPAQTVSIRQPFLERMRLRQQQWRGSIGGKIRAPAEKPHMLLISVKRQRKAKMKKHKLKKLRKRTRNLRRKLGKL